MPQALQPSRESLLHPGQPRHRSMVTQMPSIPGQFGQAQFRELHGAGQILLVPFVIDCQLFASQNAVLRVARKLIPQGCRRFQLAAALCHQRQFASCLRAERGG